MLEYSTPSVSKRFEMRWISFAAGVLLGEVIAFILLSIILADGPIFPFTLLFAPLAVMVEIFGSDRALIFGPFAGGPLLYGLYGFLLKSRKRVRNLSIAGSAHLLCFAITLWQRDVFSVI